MLRQVSNRWRGSRLTNMMSFIAKFTDEQRAAVVSAQVEGWSN